VIVDKGNMLSASTGSLSSLSKMVILPMGLVFQDMHVQVESYVSSSPVITPGVKMNNEQREAGILR
jgi:hypothetical protein